MGTDKRDIMNGRDVTNYPEYLYHYTTVDTLALILKNKTIRFNQLSNTDDLEESMTGDLGQFGKYMFVSCWTESEEDNIPMWYMYSNKLSGVRIKLPYIPFKDYFDDYLAIAENKPDETWLSKNTFKLFFPPEYLNHKLTYVAEFAFRDHDCRVIYTDDEKLIRPNIQEILSDGLTLKVGSIGKYKRSCWEFQKEWRYRIQVYYFGQMDVIKHGMSAIHKGLELMRQNVDLPISYIDLKISDEAFSKMEIMKGPGMTHAQSIIVDEFVKNYNPDAKVEWSRLRGKIRVKE